MRRRNEAFHPTVAGICKRFRKKVHEIHGQSGTLPGEENLNITKSKEVNILFLRRDGVDGDKADCKRLMRTVTICQKVKRDTDAEGLCASHTNNQLLCL